MMEKNGASKSNKSRAPLFKTSISWDQEVPAPVLPFYGAAFFVALFAALCFYNSLNGDFVFDDSEAIVNNNDIRSDTPISSLFRNDFWGTRLTHPSSHKSYRPLTVFSFRLNYLIGGLKPFNYHVCNLILHCVVSVMSLQIFSVVYGNAPRAALLSSVLFATHPVHTEAVSGIVGRADLLCALFVFIALLCYVRAINETYKWQNKKKEDSCLRKPRIINILYFSVALSTTIAMLSKEVGITALGLCSAYDVLMAHGGIVGRMIIIGLLERNFASVYWKQIQEGTLRNLINRHVFLVIVGVLLLVIRWIVMGSTVPNILISLALGIIPFLPASNLFFRVGFVIAERVLYIPVAGLCILVVAGMRELRAANLIGKRCLQFGYVILITVFILRCRQRSRDWLTENQLFKSGLDVCPLNAKVHYNMGKVAADAGDVDEAVRRYREAIRLNKDYDQAMNNLANILKDQGQLDEALQLLLRATTIRPDFAAAWMNLGIIQASLGLHKDAENSYLTALKHRSVYPDCLYNLGNLYLDIGHHSKALLTWTNATLLKPSLAVAWTNMLILLDSEGQYERAVEIAHEALRHLPNEASLHFNLANTLGKLNEYEISEKHFLRATELEPTNANYWANLGVLYHRWKKYELAEKTYRHTLSLSPLMKSTQYNLSMLLKSMSKKGGSKR
ncbi:Transmembrane and TPR repeat-containing protein 4 [Armadillidium nasatum]|uniref:Transmembrane and TPR repeat-containing protein 4 n=1 Tax=Armadillidium nasatum TaxID=96803 RepID=A0A5N5SSA2_9CRUS|nr:Transmembrane and TPR repeat-containing protein 4 [Armadillidium nasatum]